MIDAPVAQTLIVQERMALCTILATETAELLVLLPLLATSPQATNSINLRAPRISGPTITQSRAILPVPVITPIQTSRAKLPVMAQTNSPPQTLATAPMLHLDTTRMDLAQ